MDFVVSNLNFEGSKKPQLHKRRKQLKQLKAKEAELSERCKLLQANCDVLEPPLKKVTTLAYDNPKAPIASKLWKLLFDAQYNFMNGSYSDYKKSIKLYAKEAANNLDVLPYVNQPIKVNGSVSIFSKIGRNMIKNKFLDLFRIKTPEEKKLIAYAKDTKRKEVMHKTLGF